MDRAGIFLRALVTYGLALPLAVYLGYLMAQPWGRGDFAFIFIVISLPLIPILLKYHHFFLVLSWNMSMVLFFVQGAPYLWMAMTAISLLLTALQYILKRNVPFAIPSSIAWPLVMLFVVIVITAKLTGGIGLAAFGGGGGGAIGGKRYIQLFCAIGGFFAICSHRIAQGEGNKYLALYFLGMLTMILGSIAPWMPSGLHVLYALFPVETMSFASGPEADLGDVRLGGVSNAAVGILYFVLARYGMSGLLQLNEQWRFLPLQIRGGLGINQPWRLIAAVVIVFISLLGGFRSVPLTLGLLCGLLFFKEGMHRTAWAPALILGAVLVAAAAIPFARQMPFTVQRSLSFLPIEVDPDAKKDAEVSTEWRLRMWERALPMVPQYLLVGKGYGMDAREQEKDEGLGQFKAGIEDYEGAMRASDFHSGPLSLIIPLGIFGTLAFLWFVFSGFRLLILNLRYGEAPNQRANRFLLAYFTMKIFWFFVAYGSFQNDLASFTGIVALSAAINGGICHPKKSPKPNPAYEPFRLPKPLRPAEAA